MRLHPSVEMTLPRHVPVGGAVIAGGWFPEGTRVGVNAAVMQRDKSVFGEDADAFVPERWFRSDATKMERYMFQVLAPRILLVDQSLRYDSLAVARGPAFGKNVSMLAKPR